MLDSPFRHAVAVLAAFASLWAGAATPPVPADAVDPSPPRRSSGAFDAFPESGTPGADESAGIGSDPMHRATIALDKGDTLAGVLREAGVAARDIATAVAVLGRRLDLARLPQGQTITLQLAAPEGEGDADDAVLLALSLRPEARRSLTLERDADGGYVLQEKTFEIVPRLKRARGAVHGSVIASAGAAGVPQAALAEMLRAFSYDVDFQRDIKAGDRFDVLLEQAWTEDGRPVDAGRVLWAELTTNGGRERLALYRFKPRDGESFFYDEKGESVIKALLRTPLELSRVSSGFGMRRHPLLGFTRLHAGIDFAAPSGTPILAAGDGRILEAGPNGGYGRWVLIGHGDGLATGYAHLSRIAPGVRRSARVRQGQVIGYVGSSGLSTGPHLHFELHRAGTPVDPHAVARTAARSRLTGSDLAQFRRRTAEIDRLRAAAGRSD